METRKLGNGSVFMKSAIGADQCQWLYDFAMRIGNTDDDTGFWRRRRECADERVLNHTVNRGRVYRSLADYGDDEGRLKALCERLVGDAQAACPALPDIDVTHLLVVYYQGSGGMCWHRDSDANDGDNDHPIVSISLGNTATFGYKPLLAAKQSVEVESGDVLVWGGPERMLEHAVLGVESGTSPIEGLDARLNFTFRSARNILGKEHEFDSKNFYVDPS
jgi:alkylated DNA repair dioxygenase AlkB